MSEYLSFNYHVDGITTRLTHTLEEKQRLRETGEWHGSFEKAKAYLEAQKLQAQQDLEDAKKSQKKTSKADK